MYVTGKQHGYIFKAFSEKEGDSGWVNLGRWLGGAESGAWRVTLSLVWSLCTWHGRKLAMKGGSDYCLINTERESPHLPSRIRWGTCQSVGSFMDRARYAVPNGTFTCQIKHLYLFLSPFTGPFLSYGLFCLCCSSTKFSWATFLVCNNNKWSREDCKHSVS